MLLPRGTPSGMTFDLFVIVSDWLDNNGTDDFDEGASYCGIKWQANSDLHAMGFPFDRQFNVKYGDVKQLAVKFSNMMVVKASIVYEKEDS